ncbi:unnamed protein product [Echinostoma caproni]|uniref:FAS1 domain-containing protein n=1 Tax=Echinostoma caproni TaxID=27848 RepID=A0A3P8HBA4_9TREM|nr:unnamed protein product [Echinostoma caproni]
MFYDARLAKHGYVASQVVVWDEMATNGIIHTINGLPGIPTEKIEDYIARNGQFSKFAAYQFVQNLTLGAPYTFCAPTNTALLAMEGSTTVGLVLLQNQTRREYIFRRHAFPMQLLLEDLQLKSYDVATANYAFTREEIRLTVSSANNNKRGMCPSRILIDLSSFRNPSTGSG